MRDVAPFAGLAQAVAFDGMGQNHRRRALRFDGGFVGGVDLGGIVPAALQAAKLLVAQVGHEGFQPRIRAEKVLADVIAGADDVLLILAVDRLAHPLHQHAVAVAGQQRIPIGAPEHFDDVPAGAAESPFQFLDDLAVAAYRPVEPLEIAVDHEDQIVELLAAGQRDRAEGLGLVVFAVAQEGPNARRRGVGLDSAIDQIMVEPRLVDRHDRPEAHRHRGKLPEIGHQPRMRIRREPRRRLQLAAEVLQVLFAKPAQQERPSVDARRGMALEEDLVGRLAALLAVEEVVERHFVQRGGRGVG